MGVDGGGASATSLPAGLGSWRGGDSTTVFGGLGFAAVDFVAAAPVTEASVFGFEDGVTAGGWLRVGGRAVGGEPVRGASAAWRAAGGAS